MATWKKILLEGQQANLGDSNLTQSDALRTFNTGTQQEFQIFGSNGGGNAVNLKIDNTGAATDADTRAEAQFGFSAGQYTQAELMAGNKSKLGLNEDTGYFYGNKFKVSAQSVSPHSFRIEYRESGAALGPLLTLARESQTISLLDKLGAIDFNAWQDYDSQSFQETENVYARIQGQVSKSSTDAGLLNFYVKPSTGDIDTTQGSTSHALELQTRSNDTLLTERENDAISAKFYGSSLLSLVRSPIHLYPVNRLQELTSTGNTNAPSFDLVYNGLTCSASRGIPIPHDEAWVVGVSCQYNVTTQDSVSGETRRGLITIEVYKNGGSTQADLLYSAQFGSSTFGVQTKTLETHNNKGTDVSNGYVEKNDFLRVRVKVQANNGPTDNFAIDDLVCNVMVYNEI